MTRAGRTVILIIIALSVCAWLFTGCECCGGTGDPLEIPITVSITAPTGMQGAVDADWSASWTGGTEPYTVNWDFGGGANPDTVSATVDTMSHACTVEMFNPSITDNANYTATLTVTDVNGKEVTATVVYSVGPRDRQAPVIESAYYNPPWLNVTVSSPEDDAILTVSVSVPEDFSVDASSKVPAQTGPYSATFVWDTAKVIHGCSDTTTVTATDQYGYSSSTEVNIWFPGAMLSADTLYVLPLQASAAVGDTVTIIVATGPTTNAFQYLVGANVTMPTWCTYAAESFNIGSVGGHWTDADGIWGPEGMGISNGSFLSIMGPDSFLYGQEKADIGIEGRHRLELSVVPLGGSDITGVSGALCNFGVEFSQAGTATFGFIESQPPIDRTYYRDGAGNDYYWGTLSAGPDGELKTSEVVVNEIVVSE